MDRTPPSTHEKALQINLDAAKHGTFAEIGAGQEVARWFFHVGGAAGTVAKTISAYDMAVSDAIYGPTDRYVSRRRLAAMFDHEWQLLLERLGPTRGDTTTFFVFADTVATRSRSHPDNAHGWMGVRFQGELKSVPSEIILHVQMLDAENTREQEALGILGVNLIHGAFYSSGDSAALIASLTDNLAPGRFEIDMIKFSGPCFANVDNRLMSLQLVEQNFTEATMFTAGGEVMQPTDALYKKPVLVERGSFRPITLPTLDMLERAQAMVMKQLTAAGEQPVVLMEMSLRNLLSGDRVDHADFLARADLLGALGKTVMISRHAPHYAVATYLRKYTAQPIVFVMGVPNIHEVFTEKYYEELGGGLLEAVGRLFQRNVKVYLYPYKDPESGQLITAETVRIPTQWRHLYAHLLENELIEPIESVNEATLSIFPRDVLAKIQGGDTAWETMVPAAVVRLIKERGYFGHRPSPATRDKSPAAR